MTEVLEVSSTLGGALPADSALSDSLGTVDPATAARARKMRSQSGAETVQRTALLGVVLAQLEGVPFDGVARLLNVKELRLTKFMHGEESIPRSFQDRWESLSELLEDLHFVLRPQATWKWLNTPILELGGRTPNDAITRGKLKAVSAVVQSYRDPSFH